MNSKNSKKTPKKRHPLRKTHSSPLDVSKSSSKKQKSSSSGTSSAEKKKYVLPELTKKQFQYLKAEAHHLKPLVLVGEKGITQAIVDAVSEALDYHELIKVRLREPEDKLKMAEKLAKDAKAILIALRGHTVILFRPKNEESAYKLP